MDNKQRSEIHPNRWNQIETNRNQASVLRNIRRNRVQIWFYWTYIKKWSYTSIICV